MCIDSGSSMKRIDLIECVRMKEGPVYLKEDDLNF